MSKKSELQATFLIWMCSLWFSITNYVSYDFLLQIISFLLIFSAEEARVIAEAKVIRIFKAALLLLKFSITAILVLLTMLITSYSPWHELIYLLIATTLF